MLSTTILTLLVAIPTCIWLSGKASTSKEETLWEVAAILAAFALVANLMGFPALSVILSLAYAVVVVFAFRLVHKSNT